MKKYFISVFLVLLLVTGCKSVPKLDNGQEIVVNLNEGGISVDDLYSELKEKYALNILLDMIDTKILNEKYDETDEEKNYITLQKQNDETYYNILYKNQYSTYQQYLKARYSISTTEELDNIFRLSYRRNEAIKDYIKEHLTDSEIKDYYENSFIADIEARHILITADYTDNATDEEKTEAENKALETAKEVIKKLDEGEDFATLAKEYSKDSSSENGGSVGRFGSGDMEIEFEEAAYKLKVNEYTKEPVKTKYGYHIIMKTKEYEKDSLDDAKDEIKDTLVSQKMQEDSELGYKTLIDIRDDSDISIKDSTLSSQYDNYKYNYSK